MLGLPPDAEWADDLEGLGIDDVDRVPAAVRHVDALGEASHLRAQVSWTAGRVHVLRVYRRRHAREIAAAPLRIRQKEGDKQKQERAHRSYAPGDQRLGHRLLQRR